MGTERESGGWARPRIWASARDAVSRRSPHPGPVLSCASCPRPAQESNELSGVGPAVQSNLGPNRLALTPARGSGAVGTPRLALGMRGSRARQHRLAGGGRHAGGSGAGPAPPRRRRSPPRHLPAWASVLLRPQMGWARRPLPRPTVAGAAAFSG